MTSSIVRIANNAKVHMSTVRELVDINSLGCIALVALRSAGLCSRDLPSAGEPRLPTTSVNATTSVFASHHHSMPQCSHSISLEKAPKVSILCQMLLLSQLCGVATSGASSDIKQQVTFRRLP